MKSKIEVEPFDTMMRYQSFFRIYEGVRKTEDLPMKEAYDTVVNFCIENNIALPFSGFISFKRTYYYAIRKERNIKVT